MRVFSRVYNIIMRRIGRLWGPITHVSTNDRVAALTFDDGPHPEYTPRLLDLLGRHGAKGTFFLLGRAAVEHPDIVRRIAEEGHTVANHSWDHPAFYYLSKRQRKEQIQRCEEVLKPYGRRYLRPPYGSQNPGLRFEARRLGYKVVAWDVAPWDWLDRDAEMIAGHACENIHPGSILIFHDNLYTFPEPHYVTREPTLEAVETLLEKMGDICEFVTIPELFDHGRPRRTYWKLHPEPKFLNKLQTLDGKDDRYIYAPEGIVRRPDEAVSTS